MAERRSDEATKRRRATRSPYLRSLDGLDPLLVEAIDGWTDHPELCKLRSSLMAHTSRKAFLDTLAEAVVASHLLARRCELHFEVPTPAGKQADFEVVADGHRFFVHIKRVDTERPDRRRLTISTRLRYLERIARPYVVGLRWDDGLDDRQMQRFVTETARFIARASVGDELAVRDEAERELGAVRVMAPWEGEHVVLAIGLPAGFIDEAPRIHRLLRKAYTQFMPKAVNVVLIGTTHDDDVDDFESAVLGAHIERWDAFPPRGRRVAHGRAADGFWHGGHYADSEIAGWFHLDQADADLRCRMLVRDGATADPALIERLLDVLS